MNPARPFALWLPPPSPVALRLRALIEALAADLGSDPFAPHITLWGRVELREDEARQRTGLLAAQLPPMEVQAAGLGFLEEFYRALFLPVAGSGPLWRAYRQAAELFAHPDDSREGVVEAPPFLPHLSLAYTSRTLADRMTAARKWVAASGFPEFDFEVTDLVLIDAQGGPRDWVEVARFPLAGELRA